MKNSGQTIQRDRRAQTWSRSRSRMCGQVAGGNNTKHEEKVAQKRIFIQGKSNQSIFMKSDLILSAFKLPCLPAPAMASVSFSLVMIQHEISGDWRKAQKPTKSKTGAGTGRATAVAVTVALAVTTNTNQ